MFHFAITSFLSLIPEYSMDSYNTADNAYLASSISDLRSILQPGGILQRTEYLRTKRESGPDPRDVRG